MSFWTDGENDRDHATDVYGQSGRHVAQKPVPCARCRRVVYVDPRTDSLFASHLCDRCQAEDFAANGTDVRR